MKLESLLNEVVEWDVEILGLGDVIVMAPSEIDARVRVAKRLKKGKEGVGKIRRIKPDEAQRAHKALGHEGK
jgi:hypothetical protein